MRSVGTRTSTLTASAGPSGSGLTRGPSLPPAVATAANTSTSTRRRLADRSYSAERHPHPPNISSGPAKTGGGPPPGDERGYGNTEGSYYGGGTEQPPLPPPPPDGTERSHTNANRHLTNGERMVANAAFLNGGGGGGRRGDGHYGERGRTSEAVSGQGTTGVDICGNSVVLNNDKNSSIQQMSTHYKREENPTAKNNDGLVRPSAFKPVVPKSFHSMQNLVSPPQKGPGGGRDRDSPGGGVTRGGCGQGVVGGGMSDSGRNSLTSLPTYTSSGGYAPPPPVLGPLSASTSHINRLAEKLERPGGGSGYQNGLGTSDSGRSSSGKSSSSYQRLSHLSDAPAPLRPSPSSDDIIQDLEDRLWEREQEVLHMRRNLDQSEAAIAQVFEEKQRVWEREMEDLRQNYAARLQQVTRRAQRSQHALQAQITRLTQDKRRLQEEIAALLAQRDELERKCLDYRKEQADILPQLEETKWEVCQKAGEISLLKQQLRDSQAEVTQRAGEMVALRGQLKELNAQLKEREEAIQGLKESYTSKSLELERCEGELQRTLAEVSLLRHKLSLFEAEVLGLKQALGEMNASARHLDSSRAHRDAHLSPSGSMEPLGMGMGMGMGMLLPPASSSPSSEALLSLQSDEAKVQQRQEAAAAAAAGDLRRQLERLQGELRLERQQRERQALTFAQERHTWQDEKERVLKYQAQLQLSYVEMLQKNQALEDRVDQLSTKLTISPASPPPLPPGGLPPPALPPPQPILALPPAGLPALPASASMSSMSSLPSPPPPPPADEKKLPALHQLAPPWPVPTRLERIESTEI
ncbi:leucine zipper putative tumor suppressor 3 [Sardina pilchardus]|uniref:leucine zipper putative tumor suppressor 3 n=1 Tax=Sardina pilchardus TaxID=27697 RepID=UPI002E12F23F